MGYKDETLLEVKGVSKVFTQKAPAHIVLDDVSFAVEQGQFVSMGPSGCGKTTLLTMLGGFYAPMPAEIILAGNRVGRTGARQRLCFKITPFSPG